jgi:hypothetical protein
MAWKDGRSRKAGTERIIVRAPTVNTTNTIDNPGLDADTTTINHTETTQIQVATMQSLARIEKYLSILSGVDLSDWEPED